MQFRQFGPEDQPVICDEFVKYKVHHVFTHELLRACSVLFVDAGHRLEAELLKTEIISLFDLQRLQKFQNPNFLTYL